METKNTIIDSFASKFDGSSTRIASIMQAAFDRAIDARADGLIGTIVNERISEMETLVEQIQLLEGLKGRVTEALKSRSHT